MELSRAVPVLPCRHCGVVGIPQVSPGTGPHIAKASCDSCGRFLKWLPRALVRLSGKEAPRMGGVNRMIVVGQVGKYGVEVRYSHTGTPCASFTLAVSELG
jgi:hypothetical protein